METNSSEMDNRRKLIEKLHVKWKGLLELAYDAISLNESSFNCDPIYELLDETQKVLIPIQNETTVLKEYVQLILAVHEFELLPQYICDDFSDCQGLASDILEINCYI